MKEEKRNVVWHGKCPVTVFAHTNPLHLDVFQSVARFEAEVVAMTATLVGSKEKSSGGEICGNMTAGGNESMLLAVKSSRDHMKAKKGITRPEMIIPESAHSGYDKTAQYFNIKLQRVPVNKEYQADVKAIRRQINKNTVLIVGSAPGFPHGIIDPIKELGELAFGYGIYLHVDPCLVGFVLPFALKLGYPIPPLDFSAKGVTSISVDVHKHGLAPKGTSVVLYRNHHVRKHQFVAVTEWSGGFYVSPAIAGSRPGDLIAGAWAALMSMGLEGYLENTKAIMEASKKIQEGFVVLTIFPSIHICVTLQHVPVFEDLLRDLRESVLTVKENPGPISGGLAPIYGAAGRIPDRGMVQELLINYMDSTC